ncbi:hypothetical protein GXW82_07810 [Streptacidiphilus sp. 4-A2]|nr:hypothetical protein [Streptacidiphilus sp. 4-A2]
MAGPARTGPSPPPAICAPPRNPFPSRPVDSGAYRIGPDEWNASGEVCLGTPGGTAFTVDGERALRPRSPGRPEAFVNVSTAPGALGLPVPVTALGDATSDWTASAASPGSYDMAYDLWYGPSAGDCDTAHSAELMIWLQATDDVDPAGSPAGGPVSLGGADYQVYQDPSSGPHSVISYVRTVPTHPRTGSTCGCSPRTRCSAAMCPSSPTSARSRPGSRSGAAGWG